MIYESFLKANNIFFRAKALEKFAEFERAINDYSINYTRMPGANVRSVLQAS